MKRIMLIILTLAIIIVLNCTNKAEEIIDKTNKAEEIIDKVCMCNGEKVECIKLAQCSCHDGQCSCPDGQCSCHDGQCSCPDGQCSCHDGGSLTCSQ